MGSGAGTGSGVVQRLDKFFSEVVLPESEYPSGTNQRDRKLRLRAVEEFRETQRQAKDVLSRVDEELDAEKALREERARSEEEKDARAAGEAQARKRTDTREDVRLILEAVERMQAARNRSRAENVLIGLMAITVLSTITLAFIAVFREEALFFAGSLLGSLLSGGEAYLFRLLGQRGGR